MIGMVWRFSLQNMPRRVLLGLSMVVLTVLVVACGSSGNNSTTKKQPVTQVLTATPTAVTLKLYKGSDFTIAYPQNWKGETSGNEVAFTDPTGNYNMTIGSPSNPNGTVTNDHLVTRELTGRKQNVSSA